MADLLGTSRPSASEERTVVDDASDADADAFEGLPVGGTLDEAARAMHAAPVASAAVPPPAGGGSMASSSAGVVPDVGGEDPLTLALRIAHQAQAQAAAIEASTAGSEEEPGDEWGSRREAESNGHGGRLPESDPGAEQTAPGSANGQAAGIAAVASGVGVVPEAPDAEDTVRAGANATTSTVDSGIAPETTIPEPTLPSESDLLAADTSDSGPVIGEETPALTEEQRASLLADEQEPDTVVEDSQPGAVPHAPSAEPTPSAPRASLPVAPREEPTIRKSGPPPALVVPTRLAPRTGTGPSGIGALGFRISSNRAVVRPAISGRPSVSVSAAPTSPSAGTPMSSGSTSIERPSERVSMERGIDRPSRSGMARPPVASVVVDPPPAVAKRPKDDAGVPVWMIGAGAAAFILVCGLGAFLVFGGNSADAPIATPTPIADTTPEPTETSIAVLTSAPPTATPARTAAPTPATPTPLPVPVRTTNPAPTSHVASFTRTPPPATPRATASPRERIAAITKGKKNALARFNLFTAANQPANLADPDFAFECFQWFSKPPSDVSQADQRNSREQARSLGMKFLARHGEDENKRKVVSNWIKLYEPTRPPDAVP